MAKHPRSKYVRCKSSPRESNARSRLADVRVAEYLTKNEKAPRLVEKSLGELHIKGWRNVKN